MASSSPAEKTKTHHLPPLPPLQNNGKLIMLTALQQNIQYVIYYTAAQCSAAAGHSQWERERERENMTNAKGTICKWVNLNKAAKLLNAWIIYLGLTQPGLMFRTSPDGTITLNTCFHAHIIDFTFIKTSNKIIVVLLSSLLTFVQCASHFCILFMHNMPLHRPSFFNAPFATLFQSILSNSVPKPS